MLFMKNKSNTTNTPTPNGGASPTATSPLTGSPINSTLHNNSPNNSSNTSTPSSISGLGPLGSSSSAPALQSYNYNGNSSNTPIITPMFNSASNLNSISSGAQSPTLSSSTTTAFDSNSTIGKNNNIIDTSQFTNNYTQFGGQPINPHSEIGSSILNKFSKYLLTKGYNSDGIFRQHPELESEIQTVKKNLLKDLSLDAEQLHIPTLTQNPYVIAELFKQYLSLLPEPLFSFHLYDSFLLTHSILSPLDRIWAYRFLLLYLPIGFRGAIRSVLTVLQKVHQNSDQTKMDSETLSKIFSPVFLRPEEQMYYMKSDQQTIEEIVKLWIEDYESISKPPTAPTNSRVTSILSTIPPHPQQQNPPSLSQFQQVLPLNNVPLSQQSSQNNNNIQPSTSPSQHPTIGLNKITGSNSLSSGNLQQKQQQQQSKPSPKLSLPTIPKDDHQQQTVVKAKPVIQTVEPLKSKSNNNKNKNNDSISSTPATISIPINNDIKSNNIQPQQQQSQPQQNNSNNSPNISRLSTLLPSSPSSSISSQEVEEKVNKIKISIDTTVSEQTLLQIKNLLKSIEKDFNYNNIIRFSTILRDAKKHMNESTEKLLGLNKSNIRTFIQEYPKPLSYNILVSSMPIHDSGVLSDQEKIVNDLKRASQVASDEISDYIYFFKLNVGTFETKEQVISTAQIFSKLKSILDSPGTSLTELVNNYNNSNGLNSSNGIDSSPNSSPLLSRFNNNFNNNSSSNLNNLINNQISTFNNNNNNNNNNQSIIPSSSSSSSSSPSTSTLSPPSTTTTGSVSPNQYNIDKSTARIIEVCTDEIKLKIDIKKNVVENADINQAFEIGKNIRIIKTTLDELYNECKLVLPEVKAQNVPGEDQLSTIRKALPILFDRFKTQIDCLSQRILYGNCSSTEEQNLIMDKLLFINRYLKV